MSNIMKEKQVLGLIEHVRINNHPVLAKVDTGANYNSISSNLGTKLNLGPVVRKLRIKTSNGYSRRDVVRAKLKIKGKVINALFNIAERSHMSYSVLIGVRTLKKGFLIDPSK